MEFFTSLELEERVRRLESMVLALTHAALGSGLTDEHRTVLAEHQQKLLNHIEQTVAREEKYR